MFMCSVLWDVLDLLKPQAPQPAAVLAPPAPLPSAAATTESQAFQMSEEEERELAELMGEDEDED